MRRALAAGAMLLALGGALTALAAPAAVADGGCVNAAIRTAQDAGGLPDCRAYELVSPQAKGDTDVAGEALRSATQVALDGNSLVYSSKGAFPGLVRGGALPYTYRAVRMADGWANESITPPSQSNFANCGTCSAGNTGQVLWLTPDLSRAVVSTTVPLAPGATDAANLYTQVNPASAFSLLTPGAPDRADVTLANGDYIYFQGATPDLAHVVFATNHPMAPGAVAQPVSDSGNLYEVSGGTVRLVSVDEHGDPIVGSSIQLGTRADVSELSRNTVANAISQDGSAIFFTAGSRLYVRKNATATALISTSARFEGATTDGTLAVVTDFADANAIKVYDGASGTAQDVVRPACATCGFLAASDDLNRIYFFDSAAHEPGQPAIPSGSDGLYLWQGGAIRYLATIGPGVDNNDFRSTYGRTPSRVMARSDDGRVLVFASGGTVDGYDNAGTYQLWRYDAVSDELTCISCPPAGAPTSNAFLEKSINDWLGVTYQHTLGDRHNISQDGRKVVFQTADALVPADTNGRIDVYQWVDGVVRLLSSGRGQYDARFLSASPSGDDVFVVTRNRLLPEDRDDYTDVYDVRAGGGFPGRPVAERECTPGDCQGALAGAPGIATAASASLVGDDEEPGPQARAASFRVGAVSAAARRQAARTGRLTVRVHVSQAGRVTVAGSARLSTRGRATQVARGTRAVSKAATVQVPLTLSKAARRALAEGRTLTVRLTVRYSRVRAARQLTLRLNAPMSRRAAR